MKQGHKDVLMTIFVLIILVTVFTVIIGAALQKGH